MLYQDTTSNHAEASRIRDDAAKAPWLQSCVDRVLFAAAPSLQKAQGLPKEPTMQWIIARFLCDLRLYASIKPLRALEKKQKMPLITSGPALCLYLSVRLSFYMCVFVICTYTCIYVLTRRYVLRTSSHLHLRLSIYIYISISRCVQKDPAKDPQLETAIYPYCGI